MHRRGDGEHGRILTFMFYATKKRPINELRRAILKGAKLTRSTMKGYIMYRWLLDDGVVSRSLHVDYLAKTASTVPW